MTEISPTVATFYENWKLYQDHLKAAVVSLTAEQLALRAAPNLRSVGEMVEHIIGARAWWFVGFMGESRDDVGALIDWDEPGGPVRTANELVAGLDLSWNHMADALARWSPTDMEHTFPHEWRGDHYDLSRSWVVWHVLEHDLHHGGEVSLTLGIHGLQAPDV